MTNRVYTAIFGKYDKLRSPTVVNHTWDYVVISDWDAIDMVGPWLNRKIKPTLEPRRESRKQKILCPFPDAQFTVWHGGNIQLKVDPDKFISLLGNDDIMAFKHPHRKCLYQEAKICKDWKLDDSGIIDAQMSRYQKEGFPSNYGLTSCWFLVRRNNERVREFNHMWWNEVSRGSVRDQLSFDYVRWKTDIKMNWMDGDLINHPWFGRYNHK